MIVEINMNESRIFTVEICLLMEISENSGSKYIPLKMKKRILKFDSEVIIL